MSKKICHISTVHNENDSRIVLKEGQSLSRFGYDTYYIVATDKEKILHGVNLLKLHNNSKNRIKRSINRIKEAKRMCVELDAEIYHFHDPELIPLGKKLKKDGKKVIYDVHEDIPKQILSKKYLGPRWIRKMIANVFNNYEKRAAKKFDAVITATDEIAANFKGNKNIAIKNYAISSVIDGAEKIMRDDNIFRVIYVGSITEIRGIKELIKSMSYLEGKARLWVLGTWENEELFEECKKIKGYEYTDYIGSIPIKDVFKYTKAADVGMCTLYPTLNYLESIPIKVIEYMASEKPIILSDFEYWKNLFGDVGYYVNPTNPESIASAINSYIENKDEAIKIGKKNRENFEKRFIWDGEEIKLIEIYNKLIES